MKTEKTLLAWQKYPEPDGTLYYSSNLSDKETVVSLFQFCKSSEAYINSDGWEFLFKTFGMEDLLELASKSSWLDESDKNIQKSDLIYQSLISGYNPLNKEKGDFDPELKEFISLEGSVYKIDL